MASASSTPPDGERSVKEQEVITRLPDGEISAQLRALEANYACVKGERDVR
ncbi:hypothetical protein AMTR_s00020p00120510 [Amborella trichopoda]|uniref:Uncharacterized protein n=1 Tax=Amborella trichopoda TaxID=13333 RepID=W1PPB5_AMBTC|nr:hypothetical protein AMTR_s00020p00120510 [Amborella trichopoda]